MNKTYFPLNKLLLFNNITIFCVFPFSSNTFLNNFFLSQILFLRFSIKKNYQKKKKNLTSTLSPLHSFYVSLLLISMQFDPLLRARPAPQASFPLGFRRLCGCDSAISIPSAVIVKEWWAISIQQWPFLAS